MGIRPPVLGYTQLPPKVLAGVVEAVTLCVRASVHGLPLAGIRMTDRMTVGLPLGPVGVVVTWILLVPYLRRLLRQRAAHVKRVAEANADRA